MSLEKLDKLINAMDAVAVRNRCVAALDEPLCRMLLREDGRIPGGLWSWKVYVDGNVHGRGPGMTRKSPLKWYASLPKGEHRVVIREMDHTKPDRSESNTLYFTVDSQAELIVDVSCIDGRIVLSLAT